MRAEHTDRGGQSLLRRHQRTQGQSEERAGCLPQGQWLSWPCHQHWVTAPAVAAAALGCHTARNSPCQGSRAQGAPAAVLLLHPASSASRLPGERKEVDGLCLRETSKGKAQEHAPEGPGRGAQPSHFFSQQAGNKTKPGPGLELTSSTPSTAKLQRLHQPSTNPSCSWLCTLNEI